MKVISFPVASRDGEISSAYVSLQGFAEEPRLEVISQRIPYCTLYYGQYGIPQTTCTMDHP